MTPSHELESKWSHELESNRSHELESNRSHELESEWSQSHSGVRVRVESESELESDTVRSARFDRVTGYDSDSYLVA